MNCVKMWHGGRNLEYSYKEITNAKGLWEYGPGLYLTTSYDRAYKYAKGGGSTYQILVEEGNDISKVNIDINKVFDFINNYIKNNKKKELLSDIKNHMDRMNKTNELSAEVFVNLIINLEAINKTKTSNLCQFLVNNNVDYSVVKNYAGSDETVLVIHNRNKIKKVDKILAKDVNTDFYLEFKFRKTEINTNHKLKR